MFEQALKKIQEFTESVNKLAAAVELLAKHANVDLTATAEKKSPQTRAPRKSSAAPATTEITPKTEPVSSTVIVEKSTAGGTPEAKVPPASGNTELPAPIEEEEDLTPPPTAPVAEKTYTAEDVRGMAIRTAGAFGEEKVKNIIKTVGNSPNIKNMDPAKYAAVMKAFAEVK